MFGLMGGALRAQNLFSSARSLALGTGGTAYAEGYRSLFINPANLGLFRGGMQIMIGLPGEISLHAGGPLANISVYNRYFTGGNHIGADQTGSLLKQWFGNSTGQVRDLGIDAEMIPLAAVVKLGRNTVAGAAVRFRTMAQVGMNRGMAQFMLRGLDAGSFAKPTPVNMEQRMLSTGEVALGVSHRLRLAGLIPDNHQLWVGGTVQLIEGLAYMQGTLHSTLQLTDSLLIHQFRYSIETVGDMTTQLDQSYQHRVDPAGNPSSDFDYQPFSSGNLVKGSGIGLDLGATYIISFGDEQKTGEERGLPERSLTLSAAVTDLGSVQFTKNPGTFEAANTFRWSGFHPDYSYIDAKYDSSFSNYMDHVLDDSVASDIYGAFSPSGRSAIRAKLPTSFHFGAYLKLHRLGVMTDIGRGFNRYGMNSDRVYVAVGAEFYPVSFLPVRVGYRFGGKTSNSFSLGTGLEFRNFRLAVGAMTVPSSREYGYNLATAISSELLFY